MKCNAIKIKMFLGTCGKCNNVVLRTKILVSKEIKLLLEIVTRLDIELRE